MSLLDNRKLYLEQWVETATKGKVEIEWAWFAKRMMLACTVCKQTLTAPIPEDVNTLDYSVQEFVKIHSHSGAHHSGCSCVSCTSTTAFPKETWTAVTADFKKIEAKVISELPMESGGQSQTFDYGELTNLPKAAKTPATQMAPPNYDKDAAKIAAQLKNFKKEYANKTDASNIGKIKALQAEEISAKQQQMLEDMKAQMEYALEEDKVAKQAALNVAKLKNFQDFQAMLDPPPSPVPEPPVKKSPVKKDVQGRKFR